MQVKSPAIALLLVPVFLLSGVFALPAEFSSTRHLDGCHDSRPVSPSPSSSHHQCCASGHDALLTPARFSVDLAARTPVPEIGFAARMPGIPHDSANRTAPPSGSPPNLTPLRI